MTDINQTINTWNDTNPPTIPERIRAARKAKGLTQQALGEILGYTGRTAETSIQRWEYGTFLVPTDKLRQLAAALDLTLDDLIP